MEKRKWIILSKVEGKIKNIVLVLPVIVLAGLAALVILGKSDSKENEKIQVLVSILPQKEFVREVGGDYVEVTELVKPGESPATYSLTARDIETISNSDVYFRIGYIPFEEANLDAIEENNPDMKIIQISEKIELRYFGDEVAAGTQDFEFPQEDNESHEDEHEHSANEIDPHLWLSIQNVRLHVDSIASSLSEIDPEHKEEYLQNAEDYKTRLLELELQLSGELAPFAGRSLVVFHPSWGYFARDYDLAQIAIEEEGNEPTADQLAGIIDEARANNAGAVFVQEQFSTVAAESIADELGVSVVKIDPLAENYIENMQKIAKIFSQNL